MRTFWGWAVVFVLIVPDLACVLPHPSEDVKVRVEGLGFGFRCGLFPFLWESGWCWGDRGLRRTRCLGWLILDFFHLPFLLFLVAPLLLLPPFLPLGISAYRFESNGLELPRFLRLFNPGIGSLNLYRFVLSTFLLEFANQVLSGFLLGLRGSFYGLGRGGSVHTEEGLFESLVVFYV